MWPWFPGIYYNHLPSNFLKSTFEKVWSEENDILDETCRDKFRTKLNCNQWLIKFWQLAEGIAEPKSTKDGYCFHIRDAIFDDMLNAVEKGKYKLICINDTVNTTDFEKQKQQVQYVRCKYSLL